MGRQVCLQPFDRIFPQDMEWFSVLDRLYMHTAFIASVPGHPWLARAVDVVLENVRQQHYGNSPLDPTGPGTLGVACNLFEKGPSWLLGELAGEHVLSHEGERIILKKIPETRGRSIWSWGVGCGRRWRQQLQ